MSLFQNYFRLSPKLWHVWLWAILLIALCVKTLLKPASHSVFPVFFHGGLHWWKDVCLYQHFEGLDYFRYSPLAAIFFSLFSFFGLTTGSLLWNLTSNALYLLGCHAFWKKIQGESGTDEKQKFFMICLFVALSGIWNSQCNITLAGLLLLALADLLDGKDMRGTLWLALALFLKITIAPVVLLVLFLRPIPLASRLAFWLGLGFLIPFLTRPPAVVMSQYQEWVNHLVSSQSTRWPGFRDGWYLWLVARQQLDFSLNDPEFWRIPAAGWYQQLQAFGGLVCAVICFWWKLRGMQPWEWLPRTMALGICWMMVLGPATEFPTYGLLAPFVGWALVIRKQPGSWKQLLHVASFLIVFMGWKELQAPFVRFLPIIQGSLPIGSTLFAIWLVQDSLQILKRSFSNDELVKTV